MRRSVAGPFLILSFLALTGCNQDQLGLPRVPVSVAAPNGGAVAFVRNHPSIDPPEQSIWLEVDGNATKIKTLGPDSDWCNRIVWSADGSTVAFLVQDARLITIDRASRRIVTEKWLPEWKGSYPPERVVTDVTLSADGREVRFVECARPRAYGFEPPRQGESLRGCVERRMDTQTASGDWRNPFAR
ncbi:MAG TPA: hypothetical protein VFV54_03765 [Thermoanaerobaculia bacterium]|nr:hypothetical protein [Thermoanaerobaculia bacterium]